MSRVSGNQTAHFQPSLSSTQTGQTPTTRQTRETPSPQDAAGVSRADGDRELAMKYYAALLQSAYGEKEITINSIPPHSTLGQWWAQLHAAFQTPEIVHWISANTIDPASITLHPDSGQITYRLTSYRDPQRKLHTLGQDDKDWAPIFGHILEAAHVIGAGSGTAITPPTASASDPVPWSLVALFYNEPLNLKGPQIIDRAGEMLRDQDFKQPDPATQLRDEDALQNLKASLGDIFHRRDAAAQLQSLAAALKTDTEGAGTLADKLKKTQIALHYDFDNATLDEAPPASMSLAQLLESHGWDLPTTPEQVANLAVALCSPVPKAVRNGNLGGALSWPEPLDEDSKYQLRNDVLAGKIGDVDFSEFVNVLEYLLNNRSISPDELSNPRALIDGLVDSPRGKALGDAIQARFEARSVKGNAIDWLLAALNVDLGGLTTGPLAQLLTVEDAGKPASAIVKKLSDWLSGHGYASSPEIASIQAHLFLANRAPEFLVNNIPDQVVVGSHGWVSFVTAVARIEAKAPGTTAAMDYAQVMLAANVAPISAQERSVESQAQTEALKIWALTNGMAFAPTDAEMHDLRKAYSAQIRELREASETQIGKMPTTRDIALQQLKQAFPEMDPKLFEINCITVNPSHKRLPGPYSILDSYIDGRPVFWTPNRANLWDEEGRNLSNWFKSEENETPPDSTPAEWVSSSSQFNLGEVLGKLKDLPRPDTLFKESFPDFSRAVKKTTTAQLKHLISKLPLEDRQNLEYGKITIRREVMYYRADHPTRKAEGALLVETERNGRVMTYEVDRLKGVITQRPNKSYREYVPSNGFNPQPGKRFDLITPEGVHPAGITAESKSAQGVLNSFSSARTQYIVDAMMKDLDLPGVERFAKGQTKFETQVPVHEIIREVALNLIPFRSAIGNFTNGNVKDGIVDLAFDIFGFAIGLGAAAKGAKGFAAGASALSKLAQGGKIIGRAAVGALNPLGGLDDLARGILKVGRRTLGRAYQGINHLRGSHQSINLLELAKRPDIAEGTYKLGNGAAESKVLAKYDEASNKWYAYDARTRSVFGTPLEKFSADASKLADTAKPGSRLLDMGLAQDNAVVLGGTMQELKSIGKGMHTYVDNYKGTKRLNIIAHGEGPDPANNFLRNGTSLYADKTPYDAKGLVDLLKSKGIDASQYDNVRLCACYSANGGTSSFAQKFQKEINKPVKGFEGPVIGNAGHEELNVLRERFVETTKRFNPTLPPAQAELMADMRYSQFHARKTTHLLDKDHGGKKHIKVVLPDNTSVTKEIIINYQPRHFSR